MSALAERVVALQRDALRGIAALRDELQRHSAGQIAAAQADYRAARLLGVLLLAVGLGLGTWGNLAPSAASGHTRTGNASALPYRPPVR
jgi:hypothetical protein